MKVTVLVDNKAKNVCYAEDGFSLYIEHEGKKILLDTGITDLFIKNAGKMNIDLKNIDYIVFSHGHYDHVGGLKHLIKYFKDLENRNIEYKKSLIICHPLAFNKKYRKLENKEGMRYENIGVENEEEIREFFDVKTSKESFEIYSNLFYLGEITRNNEFENKKPLGFTEINGKEISDFIYDDTALGYKTADGIVILTGCSHSGICNIIEQAKRICNCEKIIYALGGFHLRNPEKEVMDKTCDYIKKQDISTLGICHCTDLLSAVELSRVNKIEEIHVGSYFEF